MIEIITNYLPSVLTAILASIAGIVFKRMTEKVLELCKKTEKQSEQLCEKKDKELEELRSLCNTIIKQNQETAKKVYQMARDRSVDKIREISEEVKSLKEVYDGKRNN